MILVTGGTGFLGSHIVKRLLSEGKEIRILYRSERSRENMFRILSHYNAVSLVKDTMFFKGDLLDHFSIDDALDGIDKVIHTAAVVSFEPGSESHLYKTNIEGTANLVNACLATGRNIRLIHVSSVAALTKPSIGQTDEVSGGRQEPKSSPYAISKFLSEQEVWRGYEEGLNGFIVNPSVILGAGNWTTDSSQVFSVVKKGLKFYPPGSTGFIGVDDVVESIMFLDNLGINAESYVLNSEDLLFKDFLMHVSAAVNAKMPGIKLTRGTAIGGMYAEIIANLITGRKRILSKGLINSMMESNSFSSEKARNAGIKFSPIKKVIEDTAKLMR